MFWIGGWRFGVSVNKVPGTLLLHDFGGIRGSGASLVQTKRALHLGLGCNCARHIITGFRSSKGSEAFQGIGAATENNVPGTLFNKGGSDNPVADFQSFWGWDA
jgi:hypothetical protein